jgi:endonuclease YncB( thermonuclease family)
MLILDYTYPVISVDRIIDADTFWLTLEGDVGFHTLVRFVQEFRLDGWDCPEKHKGSRFERAQALLAQSMTTAFFQDNLASGIWVRSRKHPDDFGRYLGAVYTGRSADDLSGTPLGAFLASKELATPWPTRWYEVYDPKGRV